MLPVWSPFSSLGFHRDLVWLVHAELDAAGLDHTCHPTTGQLALALGGGSVDLRALAAAVYSRPRRDWPEVVRDTVRYEIAGAQSAERFLAQPPPAAEAGALLALRLCVGQAPSTGLRRVAAPGLLSELVYALPGGVVPVPDSHLAAWRHADAADGLFAAAAENTRGWVRSIVGQAATMTGRYDVLATANPFTASALLCLDELVGPLTPYGVLVGVPSRHELVAHVITDPDGAAEALRDLPSGVRRRNARVPAPLSPHLYWWAGSEAEPELRVVTEDTSPAELVPRVMSES